MGYFPLNGSRSYEPKPNGMSVEKEEQLRTAGNLFQEPDSTLLLSSGCGRHWPDARGIFHNDQENLFVWVNEEVLKKDGHDFMHSEHLGWILTCPSNLGTGLRAGCMVKVPKFSARKDFKEVCGKMGLQTRGTAEV